MLLIKYMSSILILLPILVLSLPVHDINYNEVKLMNNNYQQKTFVEPTHIESLQQQQEEEEDKENFNIDTTRFIQMLSSHIMVEHLETAISVLSKRLATQVQDTVKLNTQQQQQRKDNNSDDYYVVDIELLLEQLQGAIGSYIQDQLPSMWYGHSSSAALDSTPLKKFMKKKLYEFCSSSSIDQQQDNDDADDGDEKMINYQCLKTNAFSYLDKVDSYIKEQMHYTLAEMVQQDVPALLAMVDNQVRAVLHHFNTYLLPPYTQVHLNFVSLQDDPDWSNISSMDEILDIIASVENNEKIFHSVLHYASLSKASS